MNRIYSVDGNNGAIRIILALTSGPKTRKEITELTGVEHDDMTRWINRLLTTKPFNLIYIKEYRITERNFPMAVFALNVSGNAVESAQRPPLSPSTLKDYERRAARNARITQVPQATSTPVEISEPAPEPEASPVRSPAASPRPNPAHLPPSSIFDYASKCMQ